MCFFCLLPDLHFVRLHCSHDCWAHRLVWKICWSSRSYIGDDENWEKTHYKHLATAVSWILIEFDIITIVTMTSIILWNIFSISSSTGSISFLGDQDHGAHGCACQALRHCRLLIMIIASMWLVSQVPRPSCVVSWGTWLVIGGHDGHCHNHHFLNLYLPRQPEMQNFTDMTDISV